MNENKPSLTEESLAIRAYYKRHGYTPPIVGGPREVYSLERCLFKTLVGMLRAGVDL